MCRWRGNHKLRFRAPLIQRNSTNFCIGWRARRRGGDKLFVFSRKRFATKGKPAARGTNAGRCAVNDLLTQRDLPLV
jgi:hypothetical protein